RRDVEGTGMVIDDLLRLNFVVAELLGQPVIEGRVEGASPLFVPGLPPLLLVPPIEARGLEEEGPVDGGSFDALRGAIDIEGVFATYPVAVGERRGSAGEDPDGEVLGLARRRPRDVAAVVPLASDVFALALGRPFRRDLLEFEVAVERLAGLEAFRGRV